VSASDVLDAEPSITYLLDLIEASGGNIGVEIGA